MSSWRRQPARKRLETWLWTGPVGHLLGGCGAVEGVATVLALHCGVIPPTINLHYPDPECDLDYTPNEARRPRCLAQLRPQTVPPAAT